MSIGSVYLDELEIGDNRSLTKVMDADLVAQFAEVSEDRNPIHLDAEVGAASKFGECIAHGMLCASLFSALLGERLPGHGTIYMGQTLKFIAPVKVGTEVTATVTVKEIIAEKKRVIMECEAKVGDKPVIVGEATVRPPIRT